MSEPFRKHGDFKAFIDGRLLVSEVVGPWNKELIEQWIVAAYPLLKQIARGGPHVGVAIIHESAMCPPDALTSLQDALRYSLQKFPCPAHAIVAAPGVEGRTLMAPTFAAMYTGLCPFRQFESFAPAREYAYQMLGLPLPPPA